MGYPTVQLCYRHSPRTVPHWRGPFYSIAVPAHSVTLCEPA